MSQTQQRRLEQLEVEAARQRATDAEGRLGAGVEKMTVRELAGLMFFFRSGYAEGVEDPMTIDPGTLPEPATTGIRSFQESGGCEALAAWCREYEDGPLPLREAYARNPVNDVINHRLPVVQGAYRELVREHGEPAR